MSDKVTNISSSWISRPVFLSSTFKDMQAERDHLSRVVFPELSERLKKRRVLLEPIDLRQGVETQNEKDEQTRELLTLKVCLDEIDKSRPLLIVLLGDRYGWTPPGSRLQAAAQEKGFKFEVEGKSVTALEIEYGLLKKDKWLRTNSLFLFREPLPFAKMPKAKAADYSEEYSPEPNAADKAKSLKALKQKILADPELSKQIRPYILDWDVQTGLITEASLKAWGEWVMEEIWNILDAETKDVEQSLPQTWEEEEKLAIEEFVEDRSRNFVGREDVIKDLLSFARSEAKPDADWGATVTAGPGTGKSALFAKLYRELEHDEAVLLLSHAAGITPKSGDVDSMLLRWITELSLFLKITNPLPEKYTLEDLDNNFASLLSRSSVKKRIIVMIDALNQFNPTTRGLHMTWLKRPWPQNARILATAIEGEASEGLAQWAGVEEFDLKGLSPEDAEGIIVAIYTRYHRQVNLKAKEILLNKPGVDGKNAYTNPLWLNLALEQLNVLDVDDFSLALASKSDPAELIAIDIPGDIPGLYEWILKRLEKTYGTAWVVSIVALVALSRQGWREKDFAAMLPDVAELLFPNQEAIVWDPLKFAVIRRGLRGQLIQSGSHARWRFMHQQMHNAVLNHQAVGMETSLGGTTLQELIHSIISDYLLKSGYLLQLGRTDPIQINETMWHLLKTLDKAKISDYYGGFLGTEEVNAASDVLAEWLLEGTETEINQKIDFLGALLIEDEKFTQHSSIIAERYTYSLNDRIEWKTRLSIRKALFVYIQKCYLAWISAYPSNTILERELGVIYERQGTIYRAQGNLSDALITYQASMKIKEKMVSSDPGNFDWQSDLSGIYNNIGVIYKEQGNLIDALNAHTASMKIAEVLSASDPGYAGWQSALSFSYNKLGDIYIAQGNLPDALKAYQASMRIVENLVASDPDNADRLRDLSRSYKNLGDVYESQGNLPTALISYQAGMKIAEILSASDLNNAQWQRDMSLIFEKMGYIYQLQGNLSYAQIAYQASLNISEKLSASDPGNAIWQLDLSAGYEELGSVNQDQGNLSAAMTAYNASLKIRETLVASDPSNVSWQRGLSLIYNNLGVLFKVQGNLTDALNAYQESINIMEKLVASDSFNARWQRDLIINYSNLGAIYRDQGDLSNALTAYQASMNIAECLSVIDPGNFIWQRELFISYNKLGDIYQAQGNLTEAVKAFQTNTRIAEILAASNPCNADWQRDLWVSYYRISVMLYNQNNRECLNGFRKILSIMDGMLAKGMHISSEELGTYQKIINFLKIME